MPSWPPVREDAHHGRIAADGPAQPATDKRRLVGLVPVRLRETVEDVKVWGQDADGEPAAGRMDLAEGWYCLELEGK